MANEDIYRGSSYDPTGAATSRRGLGSIHAGLTPSYQTPIYSRRGGGFWYPSFGGMPGVSDTPAATDNSVSTPTEPHLSDPIDTTNLGEGGGSFNAENGSVGTGDFPSWGGIMDFLGGLPGMAMSGLNQVGRGLLGITAKDGTVTSSLGGDDTSGSSVPAGGTAPTIGVQQEDLGAPGSSGTPGNVGLSGITAGGTGGSATPAVDLSLDGTNPGLDMAGALQAQGSQASPVEVGTAAPFDTSFDAAAPGQDMAGALQGAMDTPDPTNANSDIAGGMGVSQLGGLDIEAGPAVDFTGSNNSGVNSGVNLGGLGSISAGAPGPAASDPSVAQIGATDDTDLAQADAQDQPGEDTDLAQAAQSAAGQQQENDSAAATEQGPDQSAEPAGTQAEPNPVETGGPDIAEGGPDYAKGGPVNKLHPTMPGQMPPRGLAGVHAGTPPKGFESGGNVTADRLSSGPRVRQYNNDDYSLLSDIRRDTPASDESTDRYIAAMNASTGGGYNEMDDLGKQKFREYLKHAYGRDDVLGGGGIGGKQNRDLEHARASYPGFHLGGSVTPGSLSGPNPPGADDGYAGLDEGEFVVNAQQAQKPGNQATLQQMNAGQDVGPPGAGPMTGPPPPAQALAALDPGARQALMSALSDPSVAIALLEVIGAPMLPLLQMVSAAAGAAGGGMAPEPDADQMGGPSDMDPDDMDPNDDGGDDDQGGGMGMAMNPPGDSPFAGPPVPPGAGAPPGFAPQPMQPPDPAAMRRPTGLRGVMPN
jgi:hypothetical protein